MKPDEVRAWVIARLYLKGYTTARPVSMRYLKTGLPSSEHDAIGEAVGELVLQAWAVRGQADAVGLVMEQTGASVPWAYPRLPEDRQAALRAKAPPWLREALPQAPQAAAPAQAPPAGSQEPGEGEPDLDLPMTRREALAILHGLPTRSDYEQHRQNTTRALGRLAEASASATSSEADARAINELRTRLGDFGGKLSGLQQRLDAAGEARKLAQASSEQATRAEREAAEARSQAQRATSFAGENFAMFAMMSLDFLPKMWGTVVAFASAVQEYQDALPRCEAGEREAENIKCSAVGINLGILFHPCSGAWKFRRFTYTCERHRFNIILECDDPKATLSIAHLKLPLLEVVAMLGEKEPRVWIRGASADLLNEALRKRGEQYDSRPIRRPAP